MCRNSSIRQKLIKQAANKPGFGTIMSAALQFMVAAVEIEILKFDDFTALDFPNEYSLHFAPASVRSGTKEDNSTPTNDHPNACFNIPCLPKSR
ncbi:hypothetical protein T265_03434 [Opisthorchis viverrini]|uniref:Uncharacterized protein n=1 Tax=Opisthorchis viverrini TaxID=6198 RepID=A0A075AHK9_OPIVI|nr:hypothetical protein T265_03434 [Opisthorchis viverrini]KER30064.1 hypothetical protein T265_03434 [Opisthorchis viverrini]